MTIPVFTPPQAPSVNGTDLTETPRIVSNNFGDGYTADTPDGLNVVVGVVNLNWSAITTANGYAIINFFRAQAGKPFSYTLPYETTPRSWIATSWKPVPVSGTQIGIQATLAERFIL